MQKGKTIKIKALITVLVAIVLHSCIGDGMTDTQREFFANAHKRSAKEKRFMADLRTSGYKEISIKSPSYKIDDPNSGDYNLKLECPFDFTLKNKDSIQNISDSLADVLYTKVISDSVLYVCQVVSIKLNVRKNYTKIKDAFPLQYYAKRELEVRNGFKVIEVRDGVFKRVSEK